MTITDIRRSEEGLTLVELLVATAMALVVFAVTLSTLAAFSDSSQTLNRRNNSQNQARLDVEQIVSQLRNGNANGGTSVIEYAAADDLVFQTIGPSHTSTNDEQVRYCIAPDPRAVSGTEALYTQTQPASSSPDLWNTTCGDQSAGAALVADIMNGHTDVFTYNGGPPPSDPTDKASLPLFRSVGIDLWVNPTPQDTNNAYELRSTVWLRNADYPVPSFALPTSASGTIVLDGTASYSPAGEPLTYQWSYSTGGAPPVVLSSTPTYKWTPPGTGSYRVTLTVTDQGGAAASTWQMVTVT
jgi:hypothetical protein